MVKKEVFEWIRTGQKTIELRKGKAKSGDQAVFQCGRNILRGKIVKKDEGSLATLLQSLNFKQIIPTANSVEEATAYINKLYGSTEGMFTAYRFALSR
jgi:ASC-1-like (ASCH) protein